MSVVFQSGRHAGHNTQQVLLTDPGWTLFLMEKQPSSEFTIAFRRHITDLDAKPFLGPCRHCGRKGVRASAHRGATNLMCWCADCDPRSMGAAKGKLSSILTFQDVITHARVGGGAVRSRERAIVRALAEAKGLPSRLTAKAALAFLP